MQNQRQELRDLAIRQKVILYCILIYGVLVIGQFAIPPEFRPFLLILALPVILVSTVFVFLLAMKVHGMAIGVVLGILTLIPLVGLIVLLFVNQKATATLKLQGVRVGLLGARLADI